MLCRCYSSCFERSLYLIFLSHLPRSRRCSRHSPLRRGSYWAHDPNPNPNRCSVELLAVDEKEKKRRKCHNPNPQPLFLSTSRHSPFAPSGISDLCAPCQSVRGLSLAPHRLNRLAPGRRFIVRCPLPWAAPSARSSEPKNTASEWCDHKPTPPRKDRLSLRYWLTSDC